MRPEIGDVYGRLSTRERSVLHCLADGDAKKVIACKLGIEEASVNIHVAALIRKLHSANRTQVVLWGKQEGLGSPMLPHNVLQVERLSDGERDIVRLLKAW